MDTSNKMKNTNTSKAVLIDSRLMVSPLRDGFYKSLLKNHDVYTVDISENTNYKTNLKTLRKNVSELFNKKYKHRVFIGYKSSCQLAIDLNKSNNVFDAYILLDSNVPEKTILNLMNNNKRSKKINILEIHKNKKDVFKEINNKYYRQGIATMLPFTYSQRVCREIMGWLTYKVYKVNYLNDANGDIFTLGQ